MPMDFKGEDSQSHQIASIAPSASSIERSTPKPITRAQKFELQQANQIDLKIGDSSDGRKTSAMDSIRFEADRIDSEMTSIESQQARDLVDEVLPQFAQWRANQSPDRVAQHIENYGKEVAEDLLPKFRNYSQALSAELCEVAASALGELTKA